MAELGYDVEWQVFNSANYLPQNRQRVFIVGHLGGGSASPIFPVRETGGKNKILQIAEYDVDRKNSNNYRVYDACGIAPTLNTFDKMTVPHITVGDRKHIRRLTPKECFRLQGFPDDYYDRAAAVCSDNQLYKQAGNSVTVDVIYDIAKRLEI